MTPEEKIAFKSLMAYQSDSPDFNDWLYRHLKNDVDIEIAKRIWRMEITYENQNGSPFEAPFGKKCNYEIMGCTAINLDAFLEDNETPHKEPPLGVESLRKVRTRMEVIRQAMQPVLNPIKNMGFTDKVIIALMIIGIIVTIIFS